jgi:hypothetical protein
MGVVCRGGICFRSSFSVCVRDGEIGNEDVILAFKLCMMYNVSDALYYAVKATSSL